MSRLTRSQVKTLEEKLELKLFVQANISDYIKIGKCESKSHIHNSRIELKINGLHSEYEEFGDVNPGNNTIPIYGLKLVGSLN